MSTYYTTPLTIPLMKLCLNTPIPHPLDLEFKHQPCTLTPHVECKIQIIKLDTLCRFQAGKQAFRHGIQVGGECANVDEILGKRVRGNVSVAGNEVVFYDERLPGPEVACVVERYGTGFGYLGALNLVSVSGLIM